MTEDYRSIRLKLISKLLENKASLYLSEHDRKRVIYCLASGGGVEGTLTIDGLEDGLFVKMILGLNDKQCDKCSECIYGPSCPGCDIDTGPGRYCDVAVRQLYIYLSNC